MVKPKSDQNPRPVFVLLGGTGIIGQALNTALRSHGFDVLCLSLSADSDSGDGVRNLRVDLATADQKTLAQLLKTIAPLRSIAAIIDIIGVKGAAADVMAALAAEHGLPVAVISSCLLYDHDGSRPVDEAVPSLDIAAVTQPYLLTKLGVEAYWARQDVDWLMLRTHHVLGRGSLLGCIPAHNRDRDLMARMLSGAPLALARRGEQKLSYVHPADLAEVAIQLVLDRHHVKQVVNVVHPVPVLARSYYERIAGELGVSMPEVLDFHVDPDDFWALTAKDNIYLTNHPAVAHHRFRNDIGDCIRSALSVGAANYAGQGEFLRRRLRGQT